MSGSPPTLDILHVVQAFAKQCAGGFDAALGDVEKFGGLASVQRRANLHYVFPLALFSSRRPPCNHRPLTFVQVAAVEVE